MTKPIDSIQERLTSYACALGGDRLPLDVIHATKVRVIDTFGSLIGGYDGDPCRFARKLAAQMPMPDGATYWVAMMDGKPVGGLFPTNRPGMEGMPQAWMSYLAVDDVDARVKKAAAAGAKLMRPIFDIPKVGRIAILTEPGGAGVGWITPSQ